MGRALRLPRPGERDCLGVVARLAHGEVVKPVEEPKLTKAEQKAAANNSEEESKKTGAAPRFGMLSFF